ncbi:MAG: sigma-70 family RNA polymerase sigma factor [Thermoanaerobaculia bacterium]|nr:sigma-70 family RNA polymerase sigma factor [Thermoanaerobaculia bacterium]
MLEAKSEITQLLDAWSAGNPEALDRLVPLVMSDLRRIAKAYLSRERRGHTLQTTALINEVYLRVAGREHVHWESRTQFLAGMAEIMRRILVDYARRRNALKKGGGLQLLSFDESRDTELPWGPVLHEIEVDLVALDDALESLAALDPRQARIVELRYFGGLTIEETAQTLEISPTSVKREWRSARLWLLRALSAGSTTL